MTNSGRLTTSARALTEDSSNNGLESVKRHGNVAGVQQPAVTVVRFRHPRLFSRSQLQTARPLSAFTSHLPDSVVCTDARVTGVDGGPHAHTFRIPSCTHVVLRLLLHICFPDDSDLGLLNSANTALKLLRRRHASPDIGLEAVHQLGHCSRKPSYIAKLRSTLAWKLLIS